MDDYFFSIEPFWPKSDKPISVYSENGIMASNIFWKNVKDFFCIPGNGQVGISIDSESLRGICYGVLQDEKNIPAHGIGEGVMVRFRPGNFARISNLPVSEIDANGMNVEDVVNREVIEILRNDVQLEDPCFHLVKDLNNYIADRSRRNSEQELVDYLVKQIWDSKGTISVKELEADTIYSDRYLRSVMQKCVGMTPKQMCQQVRFQNSIRILEIYKNSGKKEKLNLSILAVELGYSDQAHFCREFKNFSGMSPMDYLKLGT